MRNFTKTLLAMALMAGLPMAAQAESQFSTGNSTPITAQAKLDFEITVPKVLYLQVGTGSAFASNAAVDKIAFSVPAANLGDATPIAATAGSGDQGNGSVTARVIGNNGTITFTSTTLGPLGNGSGDTISYADIDATVSPLTSAVTLPHPTLVDGGSTSLSLIPVSGKIINEDATWTFNYLNNSFAAPGTYGGTNANNSRVTYTASMP